MLRSARPRHPDHRVEHDLSRELCGGSTGPRASLLSSPLDVAISGSTPSAEAGTLTLFGGGDREVFESAGIIFAAIAKQWFYMGQGGSGVSTKLVVNTLLGVGMQAIAEALSAGIELGPAARSSL